MNCVCHSHNGFLVGRSPEGLAQRTLLKPELDGMQHVEYLDRVGSVSALVEVEEFHVFDDQLIDQQYRRFHSGS